MEPITYTEAQLKHVVFSPSGECPIKFSHYWDLDGCSPPDTIIAAWFWGVRELGLRRGLFYTAHAIAYWVRGEFEVCTPAHDQIVESIMEYARGIGDHLAE